MTLCLNNLCLIFAADVQDCHLNLYLRQLWWKTRLAADSVGAVGHFISTGFYFEVGPILQLWSCVYSCLGPLWRSSISEYCWVLCHQVHSISNRSRHANLIGSLGQMTASQTLSLLCIPSTWTSNSPSWASYVPLDNWSQIYGLKTSILEP